jgi:hypothetical protein
MAAVCFERMERKGAAGPPVICLAHVQGLGRGQAAVYWAHSTNQAGEVKAGTNPVLIPPIPELDQQRLISSKISSICFSLSLFLHLIQLTLCGPQQRVLYPPAAGIIHPRQCAVRCISRFQC